MDNKEVEIMWITQIKQDLPSKPKAQMASGQGSHWLIESPTRCRDYVDNTEAEIMRITQM